MSMKMNFSLGYGPEVTGERPLKDLLGPEQVEPITLLEEENQLPEPDENGDETTAPIKRQARRRRLQSPQDWIL